MTLTTRQLKRRQHAQHAPQPVRASRPYHPRPASTAPIAAAPAKVAPRRRFGGPSFYIGFGVFGLLYGLFTLFTIVQFLSVNAHAKKPAAFPTPYLILAAFYIVFGAANLAIGLRIRRRERAQKAAASATSG